MLRRLCQCCLLLSFLSPLPLAAQVKFDQLPGYDAYREMASKRRSLIKGGSVENLSWSNDNKTLYFLRDDQNWKLDLQTGESEEIDADERPQGEQRGGRGGRRGGRRYVPRAQQSTSEKSPDGKWEAKYQDFNVVLVNQETDESTPITEGGSRLFRYGTANWVYGEELDQNYAMWWSPDSTQLTYYEIDERHMKEYFLTMDNTDLYTSVYAERYPKPGDDNPYVGLLVYDLETKETHRIDVGDNRKWYIYNIRYSPKGDALLFNRTNRHQSHLQVMAADPQTGKTRLVVEEKQDAWQNNSPTMRFLNDGERFIWATERNGYLHFELRNLEGDRLNPLSEVSDYPCQSIVSVDEEDDYFYYTAMSDQHPLNVHLHRARLDGSDARQLTTRPLNHSGFQISPNHDYFVCSYQAWDFPPATAVYDMEGNEVAVLAESNTSAMTDAGIEPTELFTYKAADGVTDLYGTLEKPANFDPKKKYPLIVSVYGGPSSRAIYNRFSAGNPYCELGFLIARFDNRGTSGRGKAFETAGYMKLGIIDIQDQADGVRFLAQRDYIDETRVGIYGHSYGGYMSALAILKYPDVFHTAVAGAPVTDWRNYDTIYTERYMRTPNENESGYTDGSCLTYTEQLRGKLMILHGLIDDNVHPANTWQLVNKLQRDGKRFDMMVYPNSKHGLIRSSNQVRWEYLHHHLQPEAN